MTQPYSSVKLEQYSSSPNDSSMEYLTENIDLLPLVFQGLLFVVAVVASLDAYNAFRVNRKMFYIY